jgi:hypothetical protein
MVIAARTAAYADRLNTCEGRVWTTRRAAEVIAALPAGTWATRMTQLVARTGVSPDIAVAELLDASQAWTADPPRQARLRCAERPFDQRSPAPDHGGRPPVTARRATPDGRTSVGGPSNSSAPNGIH